MLLKYNLPETARYLGYKRGAKPSEVICELIDEAYDELCKIVDPKYIFMEYDFSQTENSIVVKGVEFKSRKLLNHLKGSTSVVLMAATLGQNVDNLISEYSKTDVAMAAVIQAVSSSLIENFCDIICDSLKEELKGIHRSRFSPGYGDLDLVYQKEFFNLLPVAEILNVSLNDGFMMTPTKTVTAFIGINKSPQSC